LAVVAPVFAPVSAAFTPVLAAFHPCRLGLGFWNGQDRGWQRHA